MPPWNRLERAGAALILVIAAVTIILFADSLVAVTLQRFAAYRQFGAHMPDPVCFSPFCDYPDFWGAGVLARGHSLAVLYQPDAFLAWRRGLFGAHIPSLNWMYPPPALFPAVVISFLPLLSGYFVWSGGLTLLAVLLLRRAGVEWVKLVFALLGPAAMWNLMLGQIGILSGALLVAGLMNMQARPGTAGVMLAWLSMKPQYCFLTPFLLLAARNRRALVAAVAAGLVILAVTIACFGWQSWMLFLGPARQSSAYLLQFPYMDAQIHAISVFWALRSFHASLATSYVGQGFAAVVAVFVTWAAWRREITNPAARVALTASLLPLVTPYGYTDDLFGFCLAFLLLARRNRIGLTLCAVMVWLSPALIPLIYVRWHIVVAPLVFCAGAIIAWREMGRAARPA